MTGHSRRTALGMALVGVLLVLDSGCTGTDELVAESGTLALAVGIDPAGTGRYEQSLITLNQITVRPMDPVADASLGAVPYGMLSVPLQLTLQNPSSVFAAAIALSDGEYRVESVIFDNPILTDFNPVDPATTCLEGVLLRSVGRLPPQEIRGTVEAAKIRLGPFSPPVVFAVPRLGNKTLRLFIDGPTLTALFEAAFICRSNGFCGSTTFPAPCMDGFIPISPEAAAPAFRFE